MNLFAGTARYYDTFRPDLPEAVRAYVLQAVPRRDRLLDIGTGTGRVLEQLAPWFADTIAIEPDPHMAELACRRLQALPVRVIEATAEAAPLPELWQASLVTIVRAFHWMDRAAVLHKLEAHVAPDGVIALIADRSLWELDAPWAGATREVIKQFLGKARRTANGTFRAPEKSYADELADSTFSHVTMHTIPLTRHWNTEHIIGYLYSTSFASKALLGEQAEALEQTLRARLHRLSGADSFIEHNEVEIILARRP